VNALGVDLYSMSGHKLYAPKGVGALFVRKGTSMNSIAFGGHHERERRPGTENVPGAVGMGRAAEYAVGQLLTDSQRLAVLRDRLETAVLARISGTGLNGSREHRTPNTTNIYFDGLEGESLVIALDLRGFAVSTGAACSSGAVEPSHVLTNIGLPADRARSSIRFSLGRSNTIEQVDELVDAIDDSVSHLRRISPVAAVHA
jgi:cysteine desulfurase